ncbi:MAG: GTPase ObgE [Simkaniaceae bacterium]|nr:GTPase ObgE [Simkaniaceae bacterium]
MFVDRATLKLIAGKGGDGVVAWCRERFLPKGGPYGGNGGPGGSVLIASDPNRFSLDHLRRLTFVRAGNGKGGGANNRQGASGKDYILPVPCGTLIREPSTGRILCDFTGPGQIYTACSGGRGGRGNAFFKTSVNRIPERCTPGEQGEVRELSLELKLIADVGLVGLPSSGKSTLLNAVTATQAKTAPYPFTTLRPNIGWLEYEDYFRLSFADVPGLIEGARCNKGPGFAFLRHIERATIVVIVIACGGPVAGDPYGDFCAIRRELLAFSPETAGKPFLVALNKVDLPSAQEYVGRFRKSYPFDPETVFEISALRRTGLDSFVRAIRRWLESSRNASPSVEK